MSLPTALFSSSATASTSKMVNGAVAFLPLLIGVFIRTINEGEYGFRTRFGKAIQCRRDRTLRDGTRLQKGDVVPLGPGTYFAFPVVFSIRIIDVKIQSIDLPGRPMESGDGVQRLIEASIEYRRGTTGRALRRSELGVTNELEVMTKDVAAALLMVIADTPEKPTTALVSGTVVDLCAVHIAEKCGIDVISVKIIGNGITPAEMQRQSMRYFADSFSGSAQSSGSNVFPLPVPSTQTS